MTKMTIEELKGKGREELAQLKKDGKIGWNELLLSSYELFPETYLEWLDGDEPCEEAAEEFLSSDCSDSDGALETLYYFYGVLTAYEYLTSLSDTYWPKAVYQDWLDGISVLQLCTRNDASDFPETSSSAIAVRSRPRTN